MNIIGINVTKTSDYTINNDTQKPDSRNDENSNTLKKQVVTQELGTDTFIKSTQKDTVDATYKQPVKKKLSAEEVIELKEQQESLKAKFIKKFIADTINNQNKLLGKSTENGTYEMPKETTDLLTKIFGSVENAYPQMATTSEGAKKAIEEGGAYSTNAVADRIMTMAIAIAGDDPKKIQQMRDAVEKGFSQAGLEFNKATNSDLPQICTDTQAEVMERFDELQKLV